MVGREESVISSSCLGLNIDYFHSVQDWKTWGQFMKVVNTISFWLGDCVCLIWSIDMDSRHNIFYWFLRNFFIISSKESQVS